MTRILADLRGCTAHLLTGQKSWAAEGTEGALLIRHGTVVKIAPDDTTLADYYGGWSNLAPLPANQTGDDADHAWLEN